MSILTTIGWALLLCSWALDLLPEGIITDRGKNVLGMVLSAIALICFITQLLK